MNYRIAWTGAGLLGVAIVTTGCAGLTRKDQADRPKSVSLFDRMPWSKSTTDAPTPYPNPVKLATTWSPDTLTQSGRTPTRGFGARVFFYDEKSRPVAVDGTLIVHGFDEDASDPTKATKRFEFTPEQFTRHFSQSDLGASYSVWIPWDAVGGPQSRVSLVATFRTAEGKLIQGTPSKVLLPGAKDHSQEALAKRFSPQFRQWQQAAGGELPPSSGLATTTIRRRTPKPTKQAPATTAETPNWNLASRTEPLRSLEVSMRPDDAVPSSTRSTTSPTQPVFMKASARIPSP
ncbi:MAG: hypothetical protein AAGC97_00355 [Planctomycetota bacterium]